MVPVGFWEIEICSACMKVSKGFLALVWLKTGPLTVKVKVFALTPCFCC